LEIAFENVTKRFGGTVALEDVSFRALPGRITAFVGRNGAGKTTALRVLLGLARADTGRATLDGKGIAQAPPNTIGVMLMPAAHRSCSVRNHLGIRAMRIGLPAESVQEVLDYVDMSGFARRKMGKLSLGERQRVALAGAFMGTPKVLVLDEPANGLDPDGVIWLRDHLRWLAGQGATVLISSHILAELDQMADSVVVLDRTVRWQGDIEQMRREGFESIEGLYTQVRPRSTKYGPS
jgi:ABC-2 type transport system ATP-binding protein